MSVFVMCVCVYVFVGVHVCARMCVRLCVLLRVPCACTCVFKFYNSSNIFFPVSFSTQTQQIEKTETCVALAIKKGKDLGLLRVGSYVVLYTGTEGERTQTVRVLTVE